jgi:hypothetical protein
MSTPHPLAIAVLVVDAFDVGALVQYWHSSSLPIDAPGDGPADRLTLDSDVGQLERTVPLQPPGRASKCG